MAILDSIERTRIKYLARLRMIASEIYSLDSRERKDQNDKLKGFIEAGVITHLVSKRAIDKIIEEEKTKARQKSRNPASRSPEKSGEEVNLWRKYEQPTYLRKK